jgi:hypothetical protein
MGLSLHERMSVHHENLESDDKEKAAAQQIQGGLHGKVALTAEDTTSPIVCCSLDSM